MEEVTPIKVAFGSIPKDGGTFTFYRNQRAALAGLGVQMQCVSVGNREAALWEDDYADDGCVLLAAEVEDVKAQSQAFVSWCEANRIDIVIALNSKPILSALPHLPERIRVVSRCANAFPHGYEITMSGRERLAGIVALTPRLETDLVNDYGADPKMIRLIPNGIDASRFDEAAARPRGGGERLELGFLGRLEHNQKGVLHLPAVVRRLREHGVNFRLRIAGKGVNREALENDLRPFLEDGSVEFLGALGPSEVPGFLGSVDVYLFPSHFEGCPNALQEAMMAGCVPVSWIIPGITDYLLDDGRTGFLVPMKDCDAFAQPIVELAADRGRVAAMSQTGSARAREFFPVAATAARYAALFHEVMQAAPPPWTPKRWDEFVVDPAFKTSWRERVPAPVRKAAKSLLFRLGLTRRAS